MPYPTKLLNRNEEIALDLRPHWWYFGRQILTGIPLLILVILLLNLDGGWFKTGASWVIVALVIAEPDGPGERAVPGGCPRGDRGADDEHDHEEEDNPREGARKTTEHQPQDHAADQSTSGTFTAEVKCLVGLGLGIATTLSCRPASHKLSGD